MTLREPPTNNAIQNWFPKDGISIKNNSGIKNGKAKNLNDHETMYSSAFFKLFLLKTSFSDSKKAVKNANKNHIPLSFAPNFLLQLAVGPGFEPGMISRPYTISNRAL